MAKEVGVSPTGRRAWQPAADNYQAAAAAPAPAVSNDMWDTTQAMQVQRVPSPAQLACGGRSSSPQCPGSQTRSACAWTARCTQRTACGMDVARKRQADQKLDSTVQNAQRST